MISRALPHADPTIVESRLAARLATVLTERADALPHDLGERLRFGRELALARAREVRRAAAPAANTVVAGRSAAGAAVLAGFVPWWQRAAAVLPVVALLAGLTAIGHLTAREQMLAAADIDTQLLADDLPPEAYSDPGFAEFLRNDPAP